MTPLPCWKKRTNECDEPATAVVIVPSYEPDLPEHYVEPTCDGHAPELMHELLTSDGYTREELTTATVDKERTDG